jgi:hypothetical protein
VDVDASIREHLRQREHGPLFWFREWPNPLVPIGAAGVYTVWHEGGLLYVGMSGRGLSATALDEHRARTSTARGLFTRLASHAAGRRSGEQLCVYVADRLVVPHLAPDEIVDIGRGGVPLDHLVRDYIQQLGYRFVIVPDGKTATAVGAAVRRGGLPVGRPMLDPANNGKKQRAR